MILPRLKRLLRRRVRTLSSLDAYHRWAASYPPHAHNALMALEQTTMLGLLSSLTGLRVLDLACGTGRYGLLAQERGAEVVLGIDNSFAMLAAAPPALRRTLGTTSNIPLATNSLDGVICALALGHLPELEASIREITRVLRPGGWALISDLHAGIAARGAQRTFVAADGKTYAVEHYVHSRRDYEQIAGRVGLWMDAAVEPQLDSSGEPVLLVLRLVKTAEHT